MRDGVAELFRLCTEILRDEKQASMRLDDVVHKYRVVFQSLAGRSRTMEEKLKHLMSNRDEVKKSHEAVLLSLRLTRAKIKRVDEDLGRLKKNMDAAVAQYDEILGGKFPRSVVEESKAGADIKAKKELFISRLGEVFGTIEGKISTISEQVDKVNRLKNRLANKAKGLAGKAAMEETKLNLYQGNIRDTLLEINNSEANIRRLADDYKKLTLLLRSAPEISSWGMKVFKETVEEELATGTPMLELGAPQQPPAGVH
ncbi:MAG: hypothetical protein HY280_03950 [Nitrospinae bacterium]|nr:hypothetical protein [Nitrospinota bacterium]